ncbi:MAG TPA: DNA mismatch repair endonuclease MutL [Anaerolineae bacterium]|nr:DNA mismatch repair endonuclease MutL [Anaerolineae bacterium]
MNSTHLPRIHLLDKSIAERIAAGEVVERPASVVKELIENAIDAGAQAIAVEIRQGGVALIRVSDNGSGMAREDAPLAVERFATSKIASTEDLDAIRTLGFRGEALPSIASVTQLELLTRARDEIEGTRVRVVEGQPQTEVAGAPIGTQVTARELFYTAPARRKFLKSPLRETELIQKTVVTYALAYPHIAFRLVVDGRETLAWAAANPLERIGAVWGRNVAAEMVEVDSTSLDLRVRGFVSRPTLARASREWQNFFVNSRPIRSGLLAVMLERPYAGRLPPNRYPLAVIQIEVDPQAVDVNVHPRKAEVRFYQERAIYGAVTRAVAEALRDFPLLQPDPTDWSFANVAGAEPGAAYTLREPGLDYGGGAWRALAQIHNTYLLAQNQAGLVIVDQHAAQEQVFYERLTISALRAQSPITMNRQIQLMPYESEQLLAHLEEYRSLGIEIEPFGVNTFRVTALPAFIQVDPAELITALLQEHERYRALEGDALRDKLAAKAACLSAIKAGDVLDPAQQQALLDELLQVYSPANCPHGRPVFVMLRLEELERRLGRR